MKYTALVLAFLSSALFCSTVVPLAGFKVEKHGLLER